MSKVIFMMSHIFVRRHYYCCGVLQKRNLINYILHVKFDGMNYNSNDHF